MLMKVLQFDFLSTEPYFKVEAELCSISYFTSLSVVINILDGFINIL